MQQTPGGDPCRVHSWHTAGIMGKKPRERVGLGNEQSLTHNPFAALAGQAPISSVDRASSRSSSPHASDRSARDAQGAQRIEVRREKKGRGGKAVTLVTWLAGQPPEPLQDFAKALARSLGTGARVEDGRIVIQGDLTRRVADLLSKAAGTSIVVATP